MKTIYMTLAAVSALAIAAPAAAQPSTGDKPATQPWTGDKPAVQPWTGDSQAPQPWTGDSSNVAQLQMQLDTGIERGTITRREATPLRASLRQLIRTERQFSPNGFSGRERNSLRLRSATLHRQIDRAERNGAGRPDVRADRIDGKDDFANAGNDRRDMRGDRFNGDLRVGQHYSARPTALPMEYRARYRDSAASYYSYDNDRIYQVDRGTGMIMAMFTIGS